MSLEENKICNSLELRAMRPAVIVSASRNAKVQCSTGYYSLHEQSETFTESGRGLTGESLTIKGKN